MSANLKTGLFGFNKKATMNYIEEYQKSAQSGVAELTQQLDASKTECNKLRASIEQVESENKTLCNRIIELETELKSIKANSSSDNDNVKTRVGEIFVEAKEYADGIIKDANDKSEKIKNETIKKARLTIESIEKTLHQNEKLRNEMKKACEDFDYRIDSINSALISAKSDLELSD